MYVCEKCLGIFKHDGNHRLYCGGKLLWVSQKDAKTIKELNDILKSQIIRNGFLNIFLFLFNLNHLFSRSFR